MISGWRECKLGEHVFINAQSIDKYYPYKEIEYLDTGSITDGKIDSWQYCNLENAPSRARRVVKDNDVVLSMVRPVQRHYGFLTKTKPNSVVSTGFVVLTAKESIEPYFLYSFLTQEDITEYLDVVAEGSTSAYPAFTPDVIEKLPILLPSLPEQRAIAGVLSSLDDKIDLLHRQNKTLEGMAEALWRKMFVDNAESEWKFGKLGDFIKTTSGGTPSRNRQDYYQNGIYKWVKSKELQGTFIIDTEETITEEALNSSSAKLLPKDSLLLAMYGATVGEHGILTEEATCNQAICALIPNENYPYTFIHMFLKTNKEEIINNAVGSAQQNISQIVIQNLEFFQPNNLIIQFHEKVEGYFEKIKSNIIQSHTLARLRDTLLPELMRGNIKVKEALYV